MIDELEITRTTAQRTASIHLVVPDGGMARHMGPAIQELMKVLADQGIRPAGPMYSYHRRMPTNTFDFEVGVPVDTPVKPTGRVRSSELPAAEVVRTCYRGPYEGLPGGWMAFEQQVRKSGRTPGPVFWECYVTGPESGPDVTQWRTELNRVLIG